MRPERAGFLRFLLVLLVLFAGAIGPARAAPLAPPIATCASFKLVRPLYLMAVYGAAGDKHQGKAPLTAYLTAKLLYNSR